MKKKQREYKEEKRVLKTPLTPPRPKSARLLAAQQWPCSVGRMGELLIDLFVEEESYKIKPTKPKEF